MVKNYFFGFWPDWLWMKEKCAKSTISNTIVKLRKFKSNQKISWFTGNDISNYGPIMNTGNSIKYIKFSSHALWSKSDHSCWYRFQEIIPKESFDGDFFFECSLLCSKLWISRTFLSIHSQSGQNMKKDFQNHILDQMSFLYPFNTFCLIWEMSAKKRPHEWLGGVLGVLGLASSTNISQIKQKVFKGYPFIQ